MIDFVRGSSWAWRVVAVLVLTWPSGLRAQAAAQPDPFAGVEEMVVVGQGAATLLQDVAISVAAFDASYIEAVGATNIRDIAQFTPNLEIRSPFSASNPTLFIRGVGLRDFNANSSSSVAVYNDEVYMNSPSGQLAQFFDVEGVEVLRGPQGTLFARNASAGAIKVTARKPTGDFGGFVRTTYGRFNETSIEGAVEAPLTETLSVRIAAVYNIRDGFTLNRCANRQSWVSATLDSPRDDRDRLTFIQCFNAQTVAPTTEGGQAWNAGLVGRTGDFVLSRRGLRTAEFGVTPRDVDKWVNNRDNWAGRAIFRYQPSNELDVLFNFHGGQNRGQSRQFETVGRAPKPGQGGLGTPQNDIYTYVDSDQVFGLQPQHFNGNPTRGNPFAGDYNNTGLEKLDLIGSNLSATYLAGSWEFKSLTAWEFNSRAVDANLDANPYIGIEVEYANRSWQVSQDLKATWEEIDFLAIEGGVYYLHEKLTASNVFRLAPQAAVIQDYVQKTDAFAVYAQAMWTLAESFNIEAGGRWNFEFKDFGIHSGPTPFGPPPFVIDPLFDGRASTNISKDAPTGNLTFNYTPVDDVNYYVKFSRGWKGPAINAGAIATSGAGADRLLSGARPEEVNSLETGIKATVWGSRARLNAAAFYYDYKNLQIFQLKNESGGIPVQTLLNANDAEVFGVELEADLSPLQGLVSSWMEGLRVFGSFAWLQSEYTDFKNTKISFVGNQAIPILEDFSGNRLINSPEFSFTGYATWMFDFDGIGRIGPRFDWTFKDRVYFNQNNQRPLSQRPLWLFNLRLEYQSPDGTIEVAGWVRNLLDEQYIGDAIDLSSFAAKIVYAIGDPRTYGVTMAVRY